MKRSLFAPRSDKCQSPSPSDTPSPLQNRPGDKSAPDQPGINQLPHPSILAPTSRSSDGTSDPTHDFSASDGEGPLAGQRAAQREPRGTPGPIRVDEGSVACVIEQRLPSSSDCRRIRPSDTHLDPALLGANWAVNPQVVDPQVLEFCAWLERTASLGGSTPTPFQIPSQPSQAEYPQTKPCLTSSRTAQGDSPVPAPPAWQSASTVSSSNLALASSARDAPVAAPFRRYECENYQVCLDVAAALDWENFTCSTCNGQVDKRLLWRAKHAQRRDPFAQECCEIPDIEAEASPLVLGPKPRTPKSTSAQGRRHSRRGAR